MNDQDKREKVIKGLQEAVDWLSTETSLTVIDQWVVRDALALLKEQEPVKPKTLDGWYKCGNCHNPLAPKFRVEHKGSLDSPWPIYCDMCGKKVKWDG